MSIFSKGFMVFCAVLLVAMGIATTAYGLWMICSGTLAAACATQPALALLLFMHGGLTLMGICVVGAGFALVIPWGWWE